MNQNKTEQKFVMWKWSAKKNPPKRILICKLQVCYTALHCSWFWESLLHEFSVSVSILFIGLVKRQRGSMEIKQLKQIKAHMCLFAGKETEGNTSPEKSEDSRCLQLSLPKTSASFCYAVIQKTNAPIPTLPPAKSLQLHFKAVYHLTKITRIKSCSTSEDLGNVTARLFFVASRLDYRISFFADLPAPFLQISQSDQNATRKKPPLGGTGCLL